MHRFDPFTHSWNPVYAVTGNPPSPRYNHALAAAEMTGGAGDGLQALYVFGGSANRGSPFVTLPLFITTFVCNPVSPFVQRPLSSPCAKRNQEIDMTMYPRRH